MSNIQSIKWGPTNIKFFAGNLPETEVQKAANVVPSNFEALEKSLGLKDSFVLLDKEGSAIFSTIPTKPKATQFAAQITNDVPAAMKEALEKAANFLKGRA